MIAMRRLEEQFGKPHPELEGFKPLSPRLQWLQVAFFRLHRRRQMTEYGMQPLPFHEITHYADQVIKLPSHLNRMFIRVIEETDLAVIYDYYQRRQQ